MKTDLIIIGSGPGGYRAAEYAAENGLKTIIVEALYPGGTCLNCGCIPTKTFCKNAELIDTLKEAETFGLEDLNYKLDFNKVVERKNGVVEALRNGVGTLLQSEGITYIQGKAEFKNKNTIIVNNEEYTADNIIIATGSKAKMPPIKGLEGNKHIVTSTELLDIQNIPESICIVGAGVIGMEFASIFNSFGSKVTVIEFMKECLPMLDSDIAKRLRQTISKKGVEFNMQSGVTEIEGNTVFFEKKGKTSSVSADVILIATGRTPSVDGLKLENADVEYTPKGITVNADMQTNVSGIYAIGDVNGVCMLAHAATFQGLHVINKIINKQDNINLNIIPSAIFTNPEAGCVGVTENYCKDNDIEYICKKGYYRSNGKALAMNETEGLVKLITDKEKKIIGCHVFGAHAADIVQEISSLMTCNITAEQLADIVHTHPTLEEMLQEVAMQF